MIGKIEKLQQYTKVKGGDASPNMADSSPYVLGINLFQPHFEQLVDYIPHLTSKINQRPGLNSFGLIYSNFWLFVTRLPKIETHQRVPCMFNCIHRRVRRTTIPI